MSVVQISRIQQRRGKKNSDFGFPQLASGELGWAIDTQELYIGNGAVSEGAPYVGNSKILTEHDDILQFVALYEYQKNNNHYIQTGQSDGIPTKRSIQDRLDDIVSVRSFGVIGDGINDDTVALQRAIDQSFLNSNSKTDPSSRVTLYMEPGVYVISAEIRIPPFTHIVGSGIDSTIIYQVSPIVTNPVTPAPNSVFRMVANNPDPEADFPYSDFGSMEATERPRHILISGLTIVSDNSNRIVYLDNTDSSLFDRVRFLGNFIDLDSTPPLDQNSVSKTIGVESRGTSELFCSYNVLFNYCIFNNVGYGFYSNSDHNNVSFDHCTFEYLYDGINIGGGIYLGALNTNITNCYFDQIVRYGIYVKKGYGNLSSNNKFMLVGNDNEDYGNPTYPIILFNSNNNQSKDDHFQRNTELKSQNRNPNVAFIPNVKTSGLIYDNTSFTRELITTLSVLTPTVFLRLPLINSGTYIIDYVIRKTSLGTAIRTGTMTLTVDVVNILTTMKDEYNYVGSSTVENILFSAGLHNYVEHDPYPPRFPLDTLTIDIINPAGTGGGTMNYTYRMLTQ